jgi:hypothetical protein
MEGSKVMAWVSADGSYGGDDDIITFDGSKLTDMQWERLTDISDSDKYDYVKNILNGHDMNVREIEMENFGEEWGLS